MEARKIKQSVIDSLALENTAGLDMKFKINTATNTLIILINGREFRGTITKKAELKEAIQTAINNYLEFNGWVNSILET
jgi:hypothetical protein